MAKLIVIRHGISVWNKVDKFTGWMDVPLAEEGREEAKNAGQILKDYKFDAIFISNLWRSWETMEIILSKLNDKRIPIIYDEDDQDVRKRQHHTGKEAEELPIFKTKAISERYYGDLQGLVKEDMRQKYGAEQVHIWRRSFDVCPPGGDSLKITIDRVIPYFESKIIPMLQQGKNVLFVAHGNSIRALAKYLEKISEQDIPNLEIPYAIPIEYELDKNMNIIWKKELK